MIETKKLNDSTLKRITKSNNTYEDVHITDVPSNVISQGTDITDEVLETINYKDDNSLEFSKLTSNQVPTPETGKCILYTTSDGKFYCAIDGYNPFEISSVTASDIIKKKGATYVNNGALEYFNLNNGMKLFSNSTKIGGIPTRSTQTNNITDAAYVDLTSSEIKTIINGSTKIDITNNFVKLLHSNSSIELLNNEINMKISNIFNFKNSSNDNILSINQNGNILIGSTLLDTYIKNTIEQYVRNIVQEEIFKFHNMMLYSQTTSVELATILDSPKLSYYIYFSDTDNSETLLHLHYNGQDFHNLGVFYFPEQNAYYKMEAYPAQDDEDYDSMEIHKVDQNGNYLSSAFFRKIYFSPKNS